MHSTNRPSTFIAVAPDCPVRTAEVPPSKTPKTVAEIQYEMLADEPYVHDSDDVVYESAGKRKGITRQEFFQKGQPCLRCSPLAKRYGFGIHSDADGKVALIPVESGEYARLLKDTSLMQVKAMRGKK